MSEFPHVDGVTHHFVQAGDIRMHYAEAGAGEPLVLVHGWPQHWYAWRRVIPRLADRFRVIAVDLRGFGWSDAPRSSYAKQELADDLVAFVDALGLEQVRLAGHDWGGLAGFLACARAPERFSRYDAFAITHPWARAKPSPMAIAYVLAYQPLIASPFLGPLVQRYTPFVDGVYRLAGGDRIWSAEERRAFSDRFRPPERAEAASRIYRTFLTSEIPSQLRGQARVPELRVSSTLTIGDKDPVLAVGGLKHPGIDVREVSGGHFLPEERPELVAETLLADR